jgi:hypothetical protein
MPMKVKGQQFLQIIFFLTSVFFAGGIFATAYSESTKPPFILEAKDVLPKNQLKGSNYTVNEAVQNDGLVNTYRLTTSYGPLTVESTAELMIKIAELNAMNAMTQMDTEKIFGDAVLEGLKAPIRGIESIVKAPIETSKGIIKGTGRFFSNIGRSIVSDDPYQDNTFKVAVGYDAIKRAYAYELGIDVYSDYERLISMLGRVAQASAAGGIAPRMAMSAINLDVVTVLSLSGTSEGMRKLVRDNPPGELLKINTEKLAEMGVPSSLAEAFLNNYVYNPQETTLLVGQLASLGGVKGRAGFIAAANLASDHSVARLYRIKAEMMAGYHMTVTPVQSIDSAAGTSYLRKKDGAAILLLPLDYIYPTVDVSAKLAKIDRALTKDGITGKELWITGRVDESARALFKDSGWEVVENAYERLMKKNSASSE